ncbi:hypothetical protein ES705_45362 [subsurface metagenome]
MSISIPLILILELLRHKFLKETNFVKVGQRIAITGYLGMIFLPNFGFAVL